MTLRFQLKISLNLSNQYGFGQKMYDCRSKLILNFLNRMTASAMPAKQRIKTWSCQMKPLRLCPNGSQTRGLHEISVLSMVRDLKNLYIVLKMNSRKRESSCLTSSSTFDAKIFCRSQRLPVRWTNGSGPHLLQRRDAPKQVAEIEQLTYQNIEKNKIASNLNLMCNDL